VHANFSYLLGRGWSSTNFEFSPTAIFSA